MFFELVDRQGVSRAEVDAMEPGYVPPAPAPAAPGAPAVEVAAPVEDAHPE